MYLLYTFIYNKASSFIPVPYVADMLNKGMQIASEKLRSYANCGETICVKKVNDGPQGPGKFGQGSCKFTATAATFITLDELANFGVDEGPGQI